MGTWFIDWMGPAAMKNFNAWRRLRTGDSKPLLHPKISQVYEHISTISMLNNINRPTNQPTNQSTNRSINQSFLPSLTPGKSLIPGHYSSLEASQVSPFWLFPKEGDMYRSIPKMDNLSGKTWWDSIKIEVAYFQRNHEVSDIISIRLYTYCASSCYMKVVFPWNPNKSQLLIVNPYGQIHMFDPRRPCFSASLTSNLWVVFSIGH